MLKNQKLMHHAKHPIHYGLLDHYTYSATIENASCGDEIHVTVMVDQNIIRAIGFTAHGCLLSKGAASILYEHLIGKSVSIVNQLTNDDLCSMIEGTEIGAMRMRCVLMGLNVLRSALDTLV